MDSIFVSSYCMKLYFSVNSMDARLFVVDHNIERLFIALLHDRLVYKHLVT